MTNLSEKITDLFQAVKKVELGAGAEPGDSYIFDYISTNADLRLSKADIDKDPWFLITFMPCQWNTVCLFHGVTHYRIAIQLGSRHVNLSLFGRERFLTWSFKQITQAAKQLKTCLCAFLWPLTKLEQFWREQIPCKARNVLGFQMAPKTLSSLTSRSHLLSVPLHSHVHVLALTCQNLILPFLGEMLQFLRAISEKF